MKSHALNIISDIGGYGKIKGIGISIENKQGNPVFQHALIAEGIDDIPEIIRQLFEAATPKISEILAVELGFQEPGKPAESKEFPGPVSGSC